MERIEIESIWKDFSKPLKRFIKSRVKSDQDVEDILQIVFYKVIENISKLNETDKMNAWIYKITRNVINDFYRTQKFTMIEFSDEIISESQDKDNVNDEIAQCLKGMIQNLPEKYKQAIQLTEFENLTQKELGERLGLSESGAKSRVQRARLKLKEMILSCCSLEFDGFGNIIDYEHKQNYKPGAECENYKYCSEKT